MEGVVDVLVTVLFIVGIPMLIIGRLWLLVLAFRKSSGMGFACLILPLVDLIFGLGHWEQAGKAVILKVAGYGAMLLIAAIALASGA